MSKKKRNPIIIGVILSCSVVFASVAIWLGICWWDVWVGLILLYSLLPAAGIFACITIIVTAVLSSKRKGDVDVIALDAPIQYTSEQPQEHKYCPSCGQPAGLDQKHCVHCGYELES